MSKLAYKLVSAMVLAALLVAPAVSLAAPVSTDTINQLGQSGNIDQTRKLFDGASYDYSRAADATDPYISATLSTGDTVRFDLTDVVSRTRGTGNKDSVDYVFSPTSGGKPVAGNFGIVYRVTGDQRDTALVNGKITDGFKIGGAGVVNRLNDFNFTTYATKLANQKDPKAFANKIGAKFADKKTDLGDYLNSNKNDPFVKAVNKLNEIVADLNNSVVDGLKWAVDVRGLLDNPGVINGWKVARDLVNVLFIIVLAAASILTILRIDTQKYSVHKVLPLLIFCVIAVNFSLLAATIMTNSASVLGAPFLGGAQQLLASQPGITNGAGSLGQAVVLLIAQLIMLIGLAVLLFFFVIRIIVVWLLAIFSPLLFILMVLPLTRGEGKKLLQSWIKWVYMAPIAFFILYMGSQMPFQSLVSQSGSDSGAIALLNAIFYGGVVIAAVMIPMALGGRIMGQVAGRGGKAVGVGGKAGMGVASSLPLVGTGMTIGEARRTAGAFLEQRQAGQKGRAEERAAAISTTISDALNSNNAATAITGLDATQAQGFLERQVDHQKEVMEKTGVDLAAMRRIVAFKMGDLPGTELSQLEHAYAHQKVGELAAVKGLAQAGWWDHDTLDHYAYTGYQTLMAGSDPLLGNVKKTYRGGGLRRNDINLIDLGVAMREADSESMKKVMAQVWRRADPNSRESRDWMAAGHGEALQVWRDVLGPGLPEAGGMKINPVALRDVMDVKARNKGSQEKREAIGQIYRSFHETAQRNIREGNASDGNEWVELAPPFRRFEDYRRSEEIRRSREGLGGGEHG